MALQYSHPFIDGLQNIPENRNKELQRIRSWLSTQPHLPSFSDEYIYLFLHACYYNLDKTKSAIENYCTIRANSPSVFHDRDARSERIQNVSKLGHLVRLPKATPEGYTVLYYGVKDSDPTKLIFSDAIKGFCMFNDCILSEDGLAEGYVVIFDMKGLQIGHLARISLPVLRTFMHYIQEGHPCRLKALHVTNTVPWLHHCMRIALPLIKSEVMDLVKFHRGSIPDGIPQEILPKELGGEEPSIEELDKEIDEKLDKYHGWLLESVHFQADESKRVKKSSSSWWGLFGSNKKKTDQEILKSLALD